MNLRLLQMSDSALPIGGYTHSWGLETAIARGIVRDAQTLENWSRAWLCHALAPFEGVIVSSTARSTRAGDHDSAFRANELMTATVAPPSIRMASLEMGDQLMGLASTWEWSRHELGSYVESSNRPVGWQGWNHAVVFGLLGATAGATPEDTLLAFLHQAVNGVVTAGVRAVPVGHTHGQQILAYLHDEIRRMVAEYGEADMTLAGSGCPYYEVLCDEQSRLYARLFRS
jgi:urease accessory protein